MDTELLNKNIKINDNIFTFLKESFILIYYNMSWSLNILFGFIYLGFYKDIKLTSYFSFAFTWFSILTLQISLGFPEVLGIQISKLRGKNDITGCYKVLHKYFFILIIFIFCSLIIVYFIEPILKLIKVKEELIINSSKIIYYSIPYFIIMPFNKCLESLYISFGNKKFLFLSYTISFVWINIALYIGYKFNFRYFLYPFAKLIQEIYFLIVNLIFLNKNYISINKFLKLFNFRDVKINLWENIKYTFKVVIGINSDVISFEINALYLGMINNVVEISTWISFTNFCGLLYCVSLGISNSIRTELSYLLGKNNPHTAKSYFEKIYKKIMVTFIIISIIQYLFSNYIGLLYFNENNLINRLANIFFYFIIISSFNLTVPIFSTVCRVINKINYNFIAQSLISPISMILFGYYFIIIKNMGAIGTFINFSIAQLLIFFILFIGYKKGDFKEGLKIIN